MAKATNVTINGKEWTVEYDRDAVYWCRPGVQICMGLESPGEYMVDVSGSFFDAQTEDFDDFSDAVAWAEQWLADDRLEVLRRRIVYV